MKMTLEMMKRRKKNLQKKKRKRNLSLKMKKSTSVTGLAHFAMTIKPAVWSWSVLDHYQLATGVTAGHPGQTHSLRVRGQVPTYAIIVWRTEVGSNATTTVHGAKMEWNTLRPAGLKLHADAAFAKVTQVTPGHTISAMAVGGGRDT
jgi:ribosomal protein L21E